MLATHLGHPLVICKILQGFSRRERIGAFDGGFEFGDSAIQDFPDLLHADHGPQVLTLGELRQIVTKLDAGVVNSFAVHR